MQEPTDVDAEARVFKAAEALRLNGRTVLRFIVPQYWGNSSAEISQQMTNEMRVMWAIGNVTSPSNTGAKCNAEIE